MIVKTNHKTIKRQFSNPHFVVIRNQHKVELWEERRPASVNFLGLPEGDLLITQAWRTGGGQSTFFADAKVTDENQTVLASATGVFRYRKKFTKGPNHG